MVNVNTTRFFSIFFFPELGLKDSKNSTPEKFAYICSKLNEMESCDEVCQSVNCSCRRWTPLSKYNNEPNFDDAENGVADVGSDNCGLIGGRTTTIMMMINKKRTLLKPRIHDQILKQVGEAAHQDPDKREPDQENKICWPCALHLALKLVWGPRPFGPLP